LLSFHLVAGVVLGALAGDFWEAVAGRRHPISAWSRRVAVAASLLTVAALAFATVTVRYPYQYDHLLNAQGGVLRRLQTFLTDHADPHWLEVATWAAIVLVGLPALARAAARAPLALAGIALAGLSVIAGRPASPEGPAN